MSTSKSNTIEIELGNESLIPTEGEANLHKHVISCKKNPEHKEFVPINSFTINDLPEDHRDQMLYEYTKLTANLTVRINVQENSSNRAEEHEDFSTEAGAPDSDMRKRSGSGWVESVVKASCHENADGSLQLCPCRKCEMSSSPSREWGEVRVHTVRHVVLDDTEARSTTCRLFFDEENSPLDIIYGLKTCSSSDRDERCLLVCMSCERHLLEKLDRMIGEWKALRRDVIQRYRADNSKLAIIVSHPHGCSKQVSVGQWVEKQQESSGDRTLASTTYTYTACTCPGSSGAAVFIMGQVSLLLIDHPHCGATPEGKGYSAYGWEIDPKMMKGKNA